MRRADLRGSCVIYSSHTYGGTSSGSGVDIDLYQQTGTSDCVVIRLNRTLGRHERSQAGCTQDYYTNEKQVERTVPAS